MKELQVKPQTPCVKPLLATKTKIERLRWARRWTVPTAEVPSGGTRRFRGIGNVVCVDEKWFYICNVKQRYYVRDNEPAPSRQAQHKSHITKVMFLGAVERPRRNASNNTDLDGKLGLYPFTRNKAAQRNSRNRAAGTMVTKTVEVTKERYKKMMLDHVIPDTKSLFPRPPANASAEDKIVWIQQDNARPHLINHDPEVRAAMQADGWDIWLINHPTNSSDTNILDFFFF